MVEFQSLPDDPFQRLVVSVFRLHGALIDAGDRLVADLGLTSARWQVLGAAAKAPMPLTVASIARNMGLTRQTVRATVLELEAKGFVRITPNPHHQRANLVELTTAGRTAQEAAMQRQMVWAQRVGADLQVRDMIRTADVLQTLLGRLIEQLPRGLNHLQSMERNKT